MEIVQGYTPPIWRSREESISLSEKKQEALNLIESTLEYMVQSGLDSESIQTFLKSLIDVVSGRESGEILSGPFDYCYTNTPAQNVMRICDDIKDLKIESDKRLAYRHRLLAIAHQLGHSEAAYQLATSLKRTNHLDQAMTWYEKVPDTCDKYERVKQRLALFSQTKAILKENYVSNQSPEQNWQYAIQEERFPEHSITVSGVCFAFKTPKTIRLPDNVTLDNCTVRRGSVSFKDGQLGAIKGGKSIARGIDALAWADDWTMGTAKVESVKSGGVAVPSSIDSLKQFLISQDKEASRADCFYEMGMELSTMEWYQYESLYLLERAHAYGKVEAASKVRDQLQKLLNGNAEEEKKALEWCRNLPKESVFFPLVRHKLEFYDQIQRLLGAKYSKCDTLAEKVCKALAQGEFPNGEKVTLYELKLDLDRAKTYNLTLRKFGSAQVEIPDNVTLHNCELVKGSIKFKYGTLKVTNMDSSAMAVGDHALVYLAVKMSSTLGYYGNVIGYKSYQKIEADLSEFLNQLLDKNTRADAAFKIAKRYANAVDLQNSDLPSDKAYELCAYLCNQAQALGHAEATAFLAQTTYGIAQKKPMLAQTTYGIAQKKIMRTDEAVEWYKKAHALGCPNAMYSLAQRYMELGEYNDAKMCYEKVLSSSTMHKDAQKMLKGYERQRYVLTGWSFKEIHHITWMPKQVVLRGCLKELRSEFPNYYQLYFYQGDLCVVNAVDNNIEDLIEPATKRAAILIRPILKDLNEIKSMQDLPPPKIISVEDYRKLPEFSELYDLERPLEKRAEAAYHIGCSYKQRNGPLKQSDTLTEYFLDLALEWGHPDAAFTLGEWHLKKFFPNHDTVKGYLKMVSENSKYYDRAQDWLNKNDETGTSNFNLDQGLGWIRNGLFGPPTNKPDEKMENDGL